MYVCTGTFPTAQWIKNLPVMQEIQETGIQSLGQEDPLEKEMTTHSSILACKIPRTEEPTGYSAKGRRVKHVSDRAHSIYIYIYIYQASLVAQRLKHLPAMRETWVRSLGWEDPLENEMATHSSILAWRIP